MLKVTVYGTAVPQGSMKAFTPPGWKRPILTSDNANLKSWRQDIVDTVREHAPAFGPVDCPVEMRVTFYLPRPKSAPTRVTEPAKKPDLDKLLRAVGDALTAAGLWRDDSRVVFMAGQKAFAGGIRDPLGSGGTPRTVIEVERVGGALPLLAGMSA